MGAPQRGTLDSVATVAVIIAAIAVGGSSLWRAAHEGPPRGNTPAGSGPPRYVEGWEQVLDIGISEGSRDAPLTVIEFADMECPYCRLMHTRMEEVKERRGQGLRHVLVHYPLPQHKFAMLTASLVECAEREGRSGAMVSSLYAMQDSFGLRSWEDFARDAGVRSATETVECARAGTGMARILAGKATGDSLRIPGTPTLVINGWMYAGLTPDALEAELEKRLRGGP